jgi:hypothetical protein
MVFEYLRIGPRPDSGTERVFLRILGRDAHSSQAQKRISGMMRKSCFSRCSSSIKIPSFHDTFEADSN